MASDDLMGMIKGAVGISAALGAIKGGVELATVAAQADAARTSFDKMAQGAGTSGKALLASLQQASAGTVANTALIQNTNTALLLLGNSVATKLPALLQVARASAQATGQDVGYVFQSLVTGISRGSTELIDNAGITLSATEAYNTYAASIGKSADQLTKAERSQAILNGVLTAGQAIVAQSGTSADSQAAAMQRAAAAVDNLKIALGQGLLPIVGTVASALTQVATFNDQLAATQDKLSQATLGTGASFEAYAQKAVAVNEQLGVLGHIEPLTQAQYAYAQSLVASGVAADEAAAKARGLSDVQQVLSGNTGLLVGTTQQQRDALAALAPQIMEVAGASDTNKAAVLELIRVFTAGGMSSEQLATALQMQAQMHQQVEQAAARDAAMQEYRRGEITQGTAATTESTGATQTNTSATFEKIAADQKAALETQQLRQAQAALANLSSAVAAGHMTAGAAALALASRYGIAYAEALKLISAQMQLARVGGLASKAFSGPTGVPKVGGAVGIVGLRGGRESAVGVGVNGAAGRAGRDVPDEPKKRRGGVGGGGGAGSAGAAAQKTTDLATSTAAKRQEIERTAGEKLQQIARATQEKIISIEQQAAARRLEAQRKLNEQIGADAANINYSQILNNFDLLNAKLTEEQRAALNEREAAEATYQQNVAKAAEEARAIAADGDAAYAEQYYAAKKAQAERQKEIDQRAAQAAREAGADQQQAVQETAAAATKANEDAAQRDIDVAKAASEARAKAVEDEKTKAIDDGQAQSQAVIAAAQEQERQLSEAAQRTAGKIKGASADATSAVVSGFNDQAAAAQRATDAANTYADAVRNLPSPPSAPGGGGGASTAPAGATHAAGGFHGVTQGPAKFVAGDNPGGVELVTVTPLSGKGRTRVGNNVAHFGGGGAMVTGPGEEGPIPDWVGLNAQLTTLAQRALAAGDATLALSTATRIAGQQALDTAARQAIEEEKTKRIEQTTTSALRAFMLLNPAIDENGVNALRAAGKITVQAAALIKGELATRRMTQVTREGAAISLVDAARKREQEASQKLLEQQLQASAEAFLKLNPEIDAAGVASLVAAGNLDPLVAQLVLAEQAARKAEAAVAKLQTTSTKTFTPDNGPANWYQAGIDRARALADAQQYLADLRSDTEVQARAQEVVDARKAQKAIEDEYAKKRDEISKTSDFENDYYDKDGNLQKGRRSKLADLEQEYADERAAAAEDVRKAEGALSIEQRRTAQNADTAARAQEQFATAQQEAAQISATDQRAGAAYLALRVQQIKELGDLEKERADLAAKAQLGDEGARIQLQALDARASAIKDAQANEILAYREQQRQQVIAGIAAARGIEEGMVEQTPELLAEVTRIMEAINQATNAALQIHSPSRVMKRAGISTIEGLEGGITDPRAQRSLIGAARDVALGVPAAMTAPLNAAQQMTSVSYDHSIGTVDARGSNWTEAQLHAIVNRALDARTRRGYGIRNTGGYGGM